MAEHDQSVRVLRIATARIDHKPQAGERLLDITVKSASGVGKLMAPEWRMVRYFKEGRIDWPTYTEQYQDLLRKRYAEYAQVFHDLIRDVIVGDKRLVLTCYCNTGPDCRQCHRFLMADILEKIALSEGYEVSSEGELLQGATPEVSLQPTLPGFGIE